MTDEIGDVLRLVFDERQRQIKKWGVQNHRDGTGSGLLDTRNANDARRECDRMHYEMHDVSWLHILQEEFLETAETETVDDLKKELVQLAAVAVAWVEAINRRSNNNG